MEENKKLSVFFNFYKVIKYIERKNIKAIVIWGGAYAFSWNSSSNFSDIK